MILWGGGAEWEGSMTIASHSPGRQADIEAELENLASSWKGRPDRDFRVDAQGNVVKVQLGGFSHHGVGGRCSTALTIKDWDMP